MKFRLVEDIQDNKVTLEVKFEVYGRYGDGGEIITAKVSGKDLRHALMRMVDKMRLYIDSDDIKERNLTAEQILDSISESNGDGCDMIYMLRNLTTNEVLIDCSDCYEEQDWDDDFDESLKESRNAGIKIPAPYDKYFEIDTDPYLDHDGYKPGDKIDYATILAYINVKEEYDGMFDMSSYMLIDDPEFPVVDIVHDRLYPVEIPGKMNENFSKEFESRELLDTGELLSALNALVKEYGHMELTTPVYLETADNSNGRTLKIGYELGEKLTESKQDDYSHNLEVVKDYIKEHPECKNDLFDTINDLSEKGVITIPATCCEDPENVTEAEAETYINNLIKQLNLNEDIFQDLNNKISEIDENARKYIYDRLTDFYMPDEPEADRKKVTEIIFKKLKTSYREMFDFIPYWGGGEDAADNMWDEGVDERITELIGYENFPEEIINDTVLDCGYIIPDND